MKDYKYVKKITPDPQVKDVADQFYDASELLWEMPPGSGVVIPTIVNSVFSVELFLKSLISYAVIKNYTEYSSGAGGGIVTPETDKTSHRLSSLFDEIELDLAKKIDHEFSKTGIGGSYQSLKECLSKYDSTFVKVRYAYEDSTEFSSTNISELRKVASFLHGYVSNMNQTSEVIK